MRDYAVGLILALGLLFTCEVALAANGAALGVNQGALAISESSRRVLTVGADIFIGDTIRTDGAGQVQIRFSDATELVIGPNSSLVLEDYLQRGDGSAGKLAIDALSGTFRFVTGKSAKSRYQITTPTGTIGIRGTAFDFIVDKHSTQVLLYHGAAVLCSRGQDCVTLTHSCEVGRYEASDSEIVGLTRKLGAQDREGLRDAFRYANSQAPLMQSFRVKQAGPCLREPAEAISETKAAPPPVVDPCADPGACAPPPPPDPCTCTPPPPDPGTGGEDGDDDGEGGHWGGHWGHHGGGHHDDDDNGDDGGHGFGWGHHGHGGGRGGH